MSDGFVVVRLPLTLDVGHDLVDFGLVDVDNRPYRHLTAALSEANREAPAVLFNSNEEMQWASDWSGLKMLRGNTGETPKPFVVYGGIGSEWLEERDTAAGERFRRKYSALRGRRLVVYFGRINFVKGLDILARAFAQVARGREDLHLVLAGPDNEGYSGRVRRWLAEGGVLEKTTFMRRGV